TLWWPPGTVVRVMRGLPACMRTTARERHGTAGRTHAVPLERWCRGTTVILLWYLLPAPGAGSTRPHLLHAAFVGIQYGHPAQYSRTVSCVSCSVSPVPQGCLEPAHAGSTRRRAVSWARGAEPRGHGLSAWRDGTAGGLSPHAIRTAHRCAGDTDRIALHARDAFCAPLRGERRGCVPRST